ncbi:MAG: sensor histidine kinase [Actinobacteria bacterium]|nr:sensor histidine kinase [Actinomycetota bacterium]
MRFSFETLTIRTKMALLVFGLVLVAIVIGGSMLIENIHSAIEKELGQRAMSIARTVAQLGEIKASLGRPGGEKVIQPIAERIRLATDVDYIVVFDMKRVRYSHPVQNRIGTPFEGGDEGPSLAEQAYISRARGVLGPSVRAFVPVMSEDGKEQVGVVVVGLLTPTFARLLRDIRLDLYLSLIAGVAVGLIGAWLLAAHIKRQMFNLEPLEIARLHEERTAVFNAIGEGIVAVDRHNRITIINDEAQRIIGAGQEVVGEDIHAVIKDTRLPQTVERDQPEYNRQMVLGGTIVLANRVPIRIKNQVAGAVAIFRDKTEVNRLAEELTGVKRFVEALRAQNHEHLNKLHTIAGLIQLKKYDEAVDFIFSLTEERQEFTRFLIRNFADYHVSGLLLGKSSRAKELGVDLTIDRSSRLKGLPAAIDSYDLVVILGNLLENAMDAVETVRLGRREVYCLVRGDAAGIRIVVRDNGPGIPPEILDRIFEPGFTTKGEANRGIGLALVKGLVEGAGGEIKVETSTAGSGGPGTTFTIRIPGARGVARPMRGVRVEGD